MKSAGSSNFFENQAAEVKTENYMMIIADPEFASEATLRVSHNIRQHSRDRLLKRDYYAHSWHNKQQAFECQLHFILGPTLKSKHLSSSHRKADILSS